MLRNRLVGDVRGGVLGMPGAGVRGDGGGPRGVLGVPGGRC